MELPLIDAPIAEARQAAADYLKAVRQRHSDEDQAILRGYRELARGRRLVQLSAAIRAGGYDTVTVRWRDSWGDRNWREAVVKVPKLAVARADATRVWTQGVNSEGECEIRIKRDLGPRNTRERMTLRGLEPADTASWRWVQAIVPIVPPPLRPATHLRNYHVLWEAEWSPEPIPPRDPALLKHLGGDLYAVVAIWDLTELERAVLAGTR